MKDRSDVSIDLEGEVCSARVWQACFQLAVRATYDPTSFAPEFEDALLGAELDGEISEFYALGVQAIFNLADESGFAADYLGMAELLVGSTIDRAVMAQWRALQQLVEAGLLMTVAEMNRVHGTEGTGSHAALPEPRTGGSTDDRGGTEVAAGCGAVQLAQSALGLHDEELTELGQALLNTLRRASRAHTLRQAH
jgi:hypothetical protein